jgi:hypothetical protein
MRADLVFKFDNTFDIYEQVQYQDPTTLELKISYVFLRSEIGLFIPGQSNLFYIATREGLPLSGAIRNAKDRNGTPIFQINGEQYDMYVIGAVPQYDPFGAVVGWRQTLSNKLPKDLDALYNRLQDAIDDEVG